LPQPGKPIFPVARAGAAPAASVANIVIVASNCEARNRAISSEKSLVFYDGIE
jgi:hypothetical protein